MVTTRRAQLLAQAALWAFILAGLLFMVVPGVWMVLSSFKTRAEITAVPLALLPETFRWDNYARAIDQMKFTRVFTNSLIVTTAVTLINLLTATWGGYTFGKLRWPGRDKVFLLLLTTLMIPGVVTFVPLFILTTNIGLTDTLPGMFLPFLAGPFGVFLMRQFISGLPDELIQAARVDGAGELRIFRSVVMPMCGPAAATLGILTFLTSWNNFLWPLVVAQDEEKYTLPVALALYSVGQNATKYGLLLAGAVVVVIPVVAIFLVLQRHIMQGIAMTGIK